MKSLKFIFLLFIVSHSLFGQFNRYAVYFTDKENSPYSINNPKALFTERAIQRRADQGIAITCHDFPPNPSYVQSVAEMGARVFYRSRWMNLVIVEATPELIVDISNLPYVSGVDFAAPGSKLRSDNEEPGLEAWAPARLSGGGFKNTFQNEMMGTKDLPDTLKGQNMLIAVFDGGFSGVNTTAPFAHLYQENRIKYIHNYVENNKNVYQYSSHGTRALSTMGAYLPAEFEGIAYKSEYILSVTEDVPFRQEHRIEEYNWLIAAEVADSLGVDIINTSLGYSTFEMKCMDYSYEDLDGQTTLITRAAEMASSKGILVVASAGNEGNDPWKYITAPSDGRHVLAVGAIDSLLTKTPFSSIGPSPDNRTKPDVVALGARVKTINNLGDIGISNGTSFAAPIVAGAAALYWQANPQLNAYEVLRNLRLSGNMSENPDNFYGYGIPNINFEPTISLNIPEKSYGCGSFLQEPYYDFADCQLLSNIDILTVNNANEKGFSVYPNPVMKNMIYIQFYDHFDKENVNINVFNLEGKTVFSKEIRDNTNNLLEIQLPEEIEKGHLVMIVDNFEESFQVKLLKL